MEAGSDAGFPGGGFFGEGEVGVGVEEAAGDVDELGGVAGRGAEGVEVAALGTEAGDEEGDVGDAGEDVGGGVGEAEDESDLVAGLGHVGDDLEDLAVAVGEVLEFDVGGAGVGGDGEDGTEGALIKLLPPPRIGRTTVLCSSEKCRAGSLLGRRILQDMPSFRGEPADAMSTTRQDLVGWCIIIITRTIEISTHALVRLGRRRTAEAPFWRISKGISCWVVVS